MHNRLFFNKAFIVSDRSTVITIGLFTLGMDIASFCFGMYAVGIVLACIAIPTTFYGICYIFAGYKFGEDQFIFRKLLKKHTIPYDDVIALVIATQYTTDADASYRVTHKLNNGRKAYLVNTRVGIFTEEISVGNLYGNSVWRAVEALPQNFKYDMSYSPYVYYNIKKFKNSRIYIPKETYEMLSKIYDFTDMNNLIVIND